MKIHSNSAESFSVSEIFEETMGQWADADCDGDVKTARTKLDFVIRYLSGYAALLKFAENLEEIEALQSALRQLKDAKDELRRLNFQTIYAC